MRLQLDPHHELAEILDPTPDPTFWELFGPIIISLVWLALGIFGLINIGTKRDMDDGCGCMLLFLLAGLLGPIFLLISVFIPWKDETESNW